MLSPICVAFNALQRLTPDSEKFRALLADGRKHFEFAAELARSSTEVERCCLNIRGLRRAGWSQRYAPFSPDLLVEESGAISACSV